jgi:hypothetical protein
MTRKCCGNCARFPVPKQTHEPGRCRKLKMNVYPHHGAKCEFGTAAKS